MEDQTATGGPIVVGDSDGFACSNCGTWVPPTFVHMCPGGSYLPRSAPVSTHAHVYTVHPVNAEVAYPPAGTTNPIPLASSAAQVELVYFSKEDRERMVRIEEKLDELLRPPSLAAADARARYS